MYSFSGVNIMNFSPCRCPYDGVVAGGGVEPVAQGAEQARQSVEVVTVEVGDEDLRYLP